MCRAWREHSLDCSCHSFSPCHFLPDSKPSVFASGCKCSFRDLLRLREEGAPPAAGRAGATLLSDYIIFPSPSAQLISLHAYTGPNTHTHVHAHRHTCASPNTLETCMQAHTLCTLRYTPLGEYTHTHTHSVSGTHAKSMHCFTMPSPRG